MTNLEAVHSPEVAVQSNGHSMVGKLRRVMVCSPRTAGWDDPSQLAGWTNLGFLHVPDFAIAQSQHEQLCRILEDAGADVMQLAPSSSLTLDAVYAHDASLPTDFGVILMYPGKTNRVKEARAQRDSFAANAIRFLGEVTAPGNTEAGDIVWLDPRTLLVGHGYRTNPAGIGQLRDMLKPHGVEVLTVPLPYGPGPSACLHLMSLISLLDEKRRSWIFRGLRWKRSSF